MMISKDLPCPDILDHTRLPMYKFFRRVHSAVARLVKFNQNTSGKGIGSKGA